MNQIGILKKSKRLDAYGHFFQNIRRVNPNDLYEKPKASKAKNKIGFKNLKVNSRRKGSAGSKKSFAEKSDLKTEPACAKNPEAYISHSLQRSKDRKIKCPFCIKSNIGEKIDFYIKKNSVKNIITDHFNEIIFNNLQINRFVSKDFLYVAHFRFRYSVY